MSDPAVKPQNFANHRAVPPIAFILAGLMLTAEIVHRVIDVCRAPTVESAWMVVVAFALLVVWYFARRSPQVMQDRIIRLETRLRLERMLPAERRADIARLSLPQLVALRFAADDQLPALVSEVVAGKLSAPDDIKRAITHWQADWLRV